MGRAGLWLLIAAPGLLLLVLPGPPVPLVSGIVLGPRGPEAGSLVRWQGSSAHTLADERGRFSLAAIDGPRRLTAWKEGFFIAGSRSRILRLKPIPTEDHEEYAWVDPTPDPTDPTRCGNCHRAIHREWSGSAHARSATGRHFRDLYSGHGEAEGWSLLDEHPAGAGVCASCHAPTVGADDPALYDLRKVEGVDRHGVHCDFCHKVAGPAEGEVGLTHGRFGLRLSRPREGQRFFGPLDDVDRGEDIYSDFQRDSRFCASCHEGVVFGVHVYSTYSEWQASPAAGAGQSCQHCHMKPTGRMTNIAPGKGGIDRDPAMLGNHRFWDGSQEAMLRRCLDLEVTTRRDGNEWIATIRLTAKNVGHRVPTGFIDRHLILHVEARDKNDRPLAAVSGPRLPAAAGARLQGQAGRLYARLLRDEKGLSPVPFWRGLPDFVDTRLMPEKPDVVRLRFPSATASLRITLRHRRFWDEVRRRKGWEEQEILVMDRRVEPGRPGNR